MRPQYQCELRQKGVQDSDELILRHYEKLETMFQKDGPVWLLEVLKVSTEPLPSPKNIPDPITLPGWAVYGIIEELSRLLLIESTQKGQKSKRWRQLKQKQKYFFLYSVVKNTLDERDRYKKLRKEVPGHAFTFKQQEIMTLTLDTVFEWASIQLQNRYSASIRIFPDTENYCSPAKTIERAYKHSKAALKKDPDYFFPLEIYDFFTRIPPI
jgi:hypothetical protein